jgi:hypothetical protein
MKEISGYVIHAGSDGTVQVKLRKDDSDEGCTSPSENCRCAENGAAVVMKVENRAGANVGDRVSVVFKAGAAMKSLLVLIGFPSIGILAGLVTGVAMTGKPGVSPLQSFLMGVACFVLSVIIAFLVYRGIAPQLKPFVGRIIACPASKASFLDRSGPRASTGLFP